LLLPLNISRLKSNNDLHQTMQLSYHNLPENRKMNLPAASYGVSIFHFNLLAQPRDAGFSLRYIKLTAGY
jgi:hypothetical protein